MPTVQLPLEDLPLNTPYALEVEGLKIVVIRTPGGVQAFEDMCPHAFWPLSAGTVRDGLIECPGHGWEFRLDSGICEESPAYCLTPIAANIIGGIVHLDRTESAVVGPQQPPTQKPCAQTHARAAQDVSLLRE